MTRGGAQKMENCRSAESRKFKLEKQRILGQHTVNTERRSPDLMTRTAGTDGMQQDINWKIGK